MMVYFFIIFQDHSHPDSLGDVPSVECNYVIDLVGPETLLFRKIRDANSILVVSLAI